MLLLWSLFLTPAQKKRNSLYLYAGGWHPFRCILSDCFWMGAGCSIVLRHLHLPAPYLIWLNQSVQHSMMEKGQVEQMIQRWDEDTCMCQLGGAWVNFCEVFISNKVLSCFQTWLVFQSMKESLANLSAATLIFSNDSSLYWFHSFASSSEIHQF